MSEWDQGTRRVDVVILTAIRLEFDAVRAVDAGAVAGSVWETVPGPSRLPVAFRAFAVDRERPLRVAVALAPDMGATAAVNTLLPLVDRLAPRCIAMCGVCAGRRGKVLLGDVVAADRLYYHDTGKQLSDQVLQDLTTYKLRDDWKAALEGMDAVARFRDEAWFQARPLTSEWREHRALMALRDGVPEPWRAVEPALDPSEWHRICRLAKVPVVCTQGLRGTQSTISIEAVSVEHVAAALGQKGPRVTRRAYLAPGAEQSSRTRKVEQLIARAP